MSKYIYPAIFTQEKNGLYSVAFPDLQGCYTQGESLNDAYEMAQDVLCLCLYELEQSNVTTPTPTNANDINHLQNEIVSLVSVDTLEYRRFYDNKAVKKTLTIPSWLNDMAEHEEINFSYVLQTALKEKLNV